MNLEMGRGRGHAWAMLATLIVCALAGMFGLAIGYLIEEPEATGIAFVFVGVSAFYGAALYRGSPDNNEWRLIERNKEYWDVKMGGWHLAFPFLDRIRENGTFAGFDVELFIDNAAPAGSDKREVLNFREGASAPVDASAWVKIGDPSGEAEATKEAVRKWVYQVTLTNRGENERLEAIIEEFEAALRPLLQGLTLEQAQTTPTTAGVRDDVADLRKIIERAAEVATRGLAVLGVYPMKNREIIIRGVELPEGVVKLRQLELEGQEQALKISRETHAIRQIMADARAAGSDMTYDEAKDLFLTQEGLRTLREANANITVVGRDMGSIITSIAVNQRGGRS